MLKSFRSWLSTHGIRPQKTAGYLNDGMAVWGKNVSSLSEPKFNQAFTEAMRLNTEGWGGQAPDIRWRAHVCCWAAQHALHLPGDFVECGVHTGLLSVTVANFLDFATLDRRFWLFDTFAGIPLDRVSAEERAHAAYNNKVFTDFYEISRRNFAPFPNAHLVRGILPESIGESSVERIAYLSMDLNNATAEMASIEVLWPRLSTGAIVVLDDYAFAGYEPQHKAWDDFARSQGQMVLTLPTGQGLLIKPPSAQA